MKTKAIFLALACAALFSCSPKPKVEYEYPFQNPDLAVEERVDNLLSLLTLEEKVSMMINRSLEIERLGIPAYNWWGEACHGLMGVDDVTVFPQCIGLAATFDDDAQLTTYTMVSDEARGRYNSLPHFGDIGPYVSWLPNLSFWCPNVNIFRDPRWGRGQETYGEDPYLTSRMGVNVVKGMQGDDPDYFKTHACAKHYAVHSGPEPLRHQFNAVVSGRDLWETYLPAFKALVTEGNVQEVMCAYSAYEGDPCCTSDRLLVDILRNRWGYEGIILSDCDAIDDFFVPGRHNTHADAASASADAVLSGTAETSAERAIFHSFQLSRRVLSARLISTSPSAACLPAASSSVFSILTITARTAISLVRSLTARHTVTMLSRSPRKESSFSRTKATCFLFQRTSRRSLS